LSDHRNHPSGRPIERRVVRSGTYTRPVRDEPLTPGLRRPTPVSAIGFRGDVVYSQRADREEVRASLFDLKPGAVHWTKA